MPVDPGTATIIGAGLGAGASTGGGIFSSIFNAKQAKKQRRWAKRMYENRYQMTMRDMEKAGLNPILAYQQGAGSVPSGASASVSMPDVGGSAARGAAAGTAAALAKAQVPNIESQTASNAASAARSKADAERMQIENRIRGHLADALDNNETNAKRYVGKELAPTNVAGGVSQAIGTLPEMGKALESYLPSGAQEAIKVYRWIKKETDKVPPKASKWLIDKLEALKERLWD